MISQKATILCVYEVLKKYSDENHILSADNIREKLNVVYDVEMERRAIYRNIEALKSMGIDIDGYKDNREGYYLIDRMFEPSEIRLLCDAVATSNIIKEETCKDIIQKLIETQSLFQGRMLRKTVYVRDRKQKVNKQLFYNVDTLNIAINQGCKVSASLMKYNKEMELDKVDDSTIVISPYATMWVSGNYYILAKQENSDNLTHYRIDYLSDITILERSVDIVFGGINPTQYAECFIARKGESMERFDISIENELWDEVAEKFGQELTVLENQKNKVRVKVRCIPSLMREWVLAHIDKCEVIGPKQFRDDIQKTILEAYRKYW